MDIAKLNKLVDELLPLEKQSNLNISHVDDLMYILAHHHDIDVRFRAHFLIAIVSNDKDQYQRPILQRMIDLYPHRAEAAWELATKAGDDREFEFLMAKTAALIPLPEDKPYVVKDIYEWRALDKVCIVGYYQGHYEDSLWAHLELKKRADKIPEWYREQSIYNGTFAINALNDNQTAQSFEIMVQTKAPSPCIGSTTDIPNVFHFMWFKGPRTFSMVHYASVASVHDVQNPLSIFVYNDVEPQDNKWWNRLKQIPSVRIINISPPKKVNGKDIPYVQHKADVARIVMMQRGGVYCDTDLVLTRPIDSLLVSNKVTICQQETFGIWNGFIAAPPHHPFMVEWYHIYKTQYGTSMMNWWCGLSIHMPYGLYLKHLSAVNLLPRHSFLPYLWNDNDFLFTDDGCQRFEKSYGIHIWETEAEKRGNLAKDVSWLKDNPKKAFAILCGKYFQDFLGDAASSSE